MNRAQNDLRFDEGLVKVKHSLLADLWGLCFTLGRTIHLTKAVHAAYIARGRQPDGLLYHEYRHLEQQRDIGLVKFLLLYLFCLPILWNPWRRRWELDACRADIAFRAHNCLGLSPLYRDFLADQLSSWRYGWMMRRAEAKRWVEETVRKFRREVKP